MTFNCLWILFPVTLFCCSVAVFHAANPVFGVLAFIMVVLHAVLLLFLLDKPFLAFLLAIVYIGAIVVLFLFVIMMLLLKLPRSAAWSLWPLFLFECTLAGFLIFNYENPFSSLPEFSYSSVGKIIYETPLFLVAGYIIFNDFGSVTLVVAFLMLVGIILAIMISLSSPARSVKVVPEPQAVRLSVSQTIETWKEPSASQEAAGIKPV